jgi:hypothetical protein
MSTTRNYDRKKFSFNTVVKCYEYTRESEEPWKPEYKEESRVMTREKELNDLKYEIPQEVRWKIEEDVEIGGLYLANHFDRMVVIEYENMFHHKLPKEALEQYIHCGSGPFETINYQRGLPQAIVIEPDGENKSNEDGIKIKLIIKPNKKHYLQTAEMRTKKVNDACPCCLLHASKAITVGSGDKSRRKTKGRSKREKNQLYYANKGSDI